MAFHSVEEHVVSPNFTAQSFCVGSVGDQDKHMHMRYTSVPSNTHAERMSDIPTLQDISRKFHHVARKPWSGWCRSGICIFRFDAFALCFQSQGRVWPQWKNWKTLLYLPLAGFFVSLLNECLTTWKWEISIKLRQGHSAQTFLNYLERSLCISYLFIYRVEVFDLVNTVQNRKSKIIILDISVLKPEIQ